MAEPGSRTSASLRTALRNLNKMRRAGEIDESEFPTSLMPEAVTGQLRRELSEKGLKGFRRGGKVKKTGLAKVHKGERVLTAKQAKAHAALKRKAATKRPMARKRK